MGFFEEHWDKIGFLITGIVFFMAWQMNQRNWQERQDEREGRRHEELIEAIHDLRSQMAVEHRGVTKAVDRLNESTIKEHMEISKALAKQSTSLDYFVGEVRSWRVKDK